MARAIKQKVLHTETVFRYVRAPRLIRVRRDGKELLNVVQIAFRPKPDAVDLVNEDLGGQDGFMPHRLLELRGTRPFSIGQGAARQPE